jgi:hypothetical protein
MIHDMDGKTYVYEVELGEESNVFISDTIEGIAAMIESELDNQEIGTKMTVRLIPMSAEDYENLEPFEGW